VRFGYFSAKERKLCHDAEKVLEFETCHVTAHFIKNMIVSILFGFEILQCCLTLGALYDCCTRRYEYLHAYVGYMTFEFLSLLSATAYLFMNAPCTDYRLYYILMASLGSWLLELLWYRSQLTIGICLYRFALHMLIALLLFYCP